MLVSHRNRFIYTKTVKTAGTSIESYFEQYCMPEGEWAFSHAREEYVSSTGIIGYRGADSSGKDWFNHMSASDIKTRLGDEIWDRYFKFCVVRNPYDKLVSYFFFLEKQGGTGVLESGTISARFRQWIRSGVEAMDRDKYVIDGETCVDFLIRYEDLENGVGRVCDKIGVPFEPERIPRLKADSRDASVSIGELYDEESIQAVKQAYAFELEEFGYSFPG